MPRTRYPRFRRHAWSKWALAVLVAFWAATGGARWWWGRRAHQRLQAEIQLIRDRGEPVALAELTSEPVPDDENAVVLYAKAVGELAFWQPAVREGIAAEVQATRPARQAIDPQRWDVLESMLEPLANHPDFRREHAAEVEEILSHKAEALALCRRARGLERAYWKIDYSGYALGVEIPWLGLLRSMAQVQRLAAVTAHERGKDGEAVETIRDMLAMGRAIEGEPFLIAHLVGMKIQGEAVETVEKIAPDLAVGSGPGSASREQVAALLRELDGASLRRGQVRAMIGERTFLYDTCEHVRARRMDRIFDVRVRTQASLLVRLLEPVLALDEAFLLERISVRVQAAKAPNYPATKEMEDKLPDLLTAVRTGPKMRHFMSKVLMPAVGRTNLLMWRQVAMHRMAKITLALRLHQLDHGRRPASLDELVPDYLRALPADPFRRDGAPPGYRPRAEHPLLYCLGQDRSDDGGSFAVDRQGAHDTHCLADMVFFLDGQRPRGACDWQDPNAAPPPGADVMPAPPGYRGRP
jgi:hypothetical protein